MVSSVASKYFRRGHRFDLPITAASLRPVTVAGDVINLVYTIFTLLQYIVREKLKQKEKKMQSLGSEHEFEKHSMPYCSAEEYIFFNWKPFVSCKNEKILQM